MFKYLSISLIVLYYLCFSAMITLLYVVVVVVLLSSMHNKWVFIPFKSLSLLESFDLNKNAWVADFDGWFKLLFCFTGWC